MSSPVPAAPWKESWDPADGAVSERRMMRMMELAGYETAAYVYAPGFVFEWHEHAHDKCDAVLEGILRVEVEGGETFDLQAGDRLHLPARTRHRAEVIGRKSVFSLDGTKW